MMNKMSQNIFDYATSELSQDAFISLMVSWFDSSNGSLKKISQDFITKLYNEYNASYLSSQLNNLEIESVKLKQQHYRIDVYFEVTRKDGDIIPFIIEDKTWTEPHSKQLQKYAERIKEPSIKIFFKTGHVTEKDIKLTNQAQYMIIDTKWIYDFLSIYKNNITDIIFTSFFEYLEREFYTKLYTESGRRKTLIDWTASDLKEGFVQYELVKTIKDYIEDPEQNFIAFTKNGKSWKTWWTFLSKENKSKFFVQILKMSEVDKKTKQKIKNKKCYRIRLIEYSNKDFKVQDKKESLLKHQNMIREILISDNTAGIEITSKARSKAKETELAYLEIIDKEKELEKYAKSFARFIQKFININSDR